MFGVFLFTSTSKVISYDMESASVSLPIFVATVLDKKSKIASISGRFFFPHSLSMLSKIMVLIPLSRLSLFSLIELYVSDVMFNLSKALLISLPDSPWDMIDTAN